MLVATTPRRDWEPALELTVNHVGHRFVLRAEGEIDIATAPLLAQQAGVALSNGALELWIDLTACEFIDVAGIHALLDMQDLATCDGRRLAVICSSDRVTRPLALTGASERLMVFRSLDEAHRLA